MLPLLLIYHANELPPDHFKQVGVGRRVAMFHVCWGGVGGDVGARRTYTTTLHAVHVIRVFFVRLKCFIIRLESQHVHMDRHYIFYICIYIYMRRETCVYRYAHVSFRSVFRLKSLKAK